MVQISLFFFPPPPFKDESISASPKKKRGKVGCWTERKGRRGRLQGQRGTGGVTPGNNKNCYETDSFAYMLGGGKKGNRFFYHYIRERCNLRLVKKGFLDDRSFFFLFFAVVTVTHTKVSHH